MLKNIYRVFTFSAVINLLILISLTRTGKPKIKGKVVGGKIPSKNSHPWLVSILKKKGGSLSHNCAGTIINRRQFLSAAHCFEDDPLHDLVVIAGIHNLAFDWRKSQWPYPNFKIEEVEMHENFDTKKLENDIALVTIKGEFNFGNKRIDQITMASPAKEQLSAWTMCYVVGWGRIVPHKTGRVGDYPEFPYKAAVPVVGKEECNRKMNPKNAETVYPGNFCAGSDGKDSCSGDSGGPLLCNGKLHGIVSWGPKECGSAYGLYTSVPYFRDWIDRRFKNTTTDKNKTSTPSPDDNMETSSMYDAILPGEANHPCLPTLLLLFFCQILVNVTSNVSM